MADDRVLREERLQEGLCPNCGTRLYKISSGGIASKMNMFKKKSKSQNNGEEHPVPGKLGSKMVPLTVAGLVERGQCLKCQEEGRRNQDLYALGQLDNGDGKGSILPQSLPAVKAVPVVANPVVQSVENDNENLEVGEVGDNATLKSTQDADLLGIDQSVDAGTALPSSGVAAAATAAPPKRSSTMSSNAEDSECGNEGVPLLHLCNIDLDPAPDRLNEYLRLSSHQSAGASSHNEDVAAIAEEEMEDERKPRAKPIVSIDESAVRIQKLRQEADATQRQIDLSFLEGATKKDPPESAMKYQCPSGMISDVFYQLPPEMQKEVLEQDKNKNAGFVGDGSDMDPETLASLPENIRREILEETRRKQTGASDPAPATEPPSLKNFRSTGRAGSLSKSTTDFLADIQIDVSEFESYPEEIKLDIIAEKKRRSTQPKDTLNAILDSSNFDDDSDSDEGKPSAYDPETLAILPEDVRKEVLEQEKRERRERQRQKQVTKATGRGAVGAHSVNVPAGYDPDTFEALPIDVQQELLDDAARMRSGSGMAYAAAGFDHDAILDAVVAPARPATGPMSSCTYTGEYNAFGKRHGDGELHWANGDKYVGKFQNGYIEGRGTINFHDGTEYSGQWKRNRFHGDGTRRFNNGNVYTGNYVDGKRQGQGRCYFANGDMYVGDWKDDTIHGFGRYYYNNGHSFEGMFRNGKRNGRGKYQLIDGRVEIYRYVNDSRVGDGVRFSANRKKAWRMVEGKVKNRVSMEEATGIANKCGPVLEES